MTNSNFPPRGINAHLWKKIQTKRQRTLKAELRDLWSLDPILWATIKGATYRKDFPLHLPRWQPDAIDRAIAKSIRQGHIKLWGKRHLPTQERHKTLKRRLSHR